MHLNKLTPILASTHILKTHLNKNNGFTKYVKEANILLQGTSVGSKFNEMLLTTDFNQTRENQKEEIKKAKKSTEKISKKVSTKNDYSLRSKLTKYNLRAR